MKGQIENSICPFLWDLLNDESLRLYNKSINVYAINQLLDTNFIARRHLKLW